MTTTSTPESGGSTSAGPDCRIGSTVALQLDRHLDDLIAGRIELGHLHPSLQSWYIAGQVDGFDQGFEAGCQRAAELTGTVDVGRLLWEREALYFLAHNKGKSMIHFYARLTDLLWAETRL